MHSAPIMLLLDTSFTMDHERIRHAVADIRDKGFDTVCVEFRNSIYDEYDPQGKAAMRIVAEETKKHGIRFLMIMPMLGPNIVKRHPEARQVWTAEHRGKVVDGRFALEMKRIPGVGFMRTEPKLSGIAKAFRIDRGGSGAIVRATDITAQIAYAIDMGIVTTISGTHDRDGEILVYAAYQTDYMDFAFPGMKESVDSFLAQYEGLALDGYAIDEFGAGSRSSDDVYLVGGDFLRAFRELHGYEFTDKLYLLKNEAASESAGKLRHDYYRLTIDLTYGLQQYVKDRYEARYGTELFGGFHSTWWGEGNSGDLWAGNIDYFRLTDNLSGGFVDAQFDAERTMLSMTMLAESLGKYSRTGHAYNMCWDRHTTREKLDYYQRLLAVRNVRWVGHAYGYVGPYGPGYPDHGTWTDTKLVLRRQKAFQQFIGQARSKPKVAMMYLWESVACFNDEYMHYHRLGMKALLDKCMRRHIEIDVVPSTENDLTRYEALVVLWPAMMPESTWQAIKDYAASGRRLVFIGPPARCTVDGRDIRGEFEALTGVRCGEAQTGKPYEGDYDYVEWDIWFTKSKIDMRCYPLTPQGAESCLLHGGDLLGARYGSVEFYAFEMPLTAYFDAFLSGLDAYRELDLSENAIAKTSVDGDLAILTLTGRWEAGLNETFAFKGNDIAIRNGTLAGFRFRGSELTDVIGETGCIIEVNGRQVPYAIL